MKTELKLLLTGLMEDDEVRRGNSKRREGGMAFGDGGKFVGKKGEGKKKTEGMKTAVGQGTLF